MTRVLFIPTGELVWFVLKPVSKDDLAGLFRDKLYGHRSQTTVWEDSDAFYFEKYTSIESFLKFVTSPLTNQSHIDFKRMNLIPDNAIYEDFELIYDD